jgi:hypothetical protein
MLFKNRIIKQTNPYLRNFYFTITLLGFLSFPEVFAQVNQIKSLSDKNVQERNETKATENTDASTDNTLNSCVNMLGCFQTSFNLFGEVLKLGEVVGVAFLKHQENLVDTQDQNPKILSCEFLPSVAYDFDKNITFLPRLRLNWGLLSTDLRYNQLTTLNEGDYATIDWQAVELNIFSRRAFYLRLGTGLSYETYNKIGFNEHSLSADILFTEKLSGDFEARFSHDGLTKIFPRTEGSFRLSQQISRKKHTQLEVFMGVLYQNYYQTVQLVSFQAGLKFAVF